jgi:hypothetical protein
MTGEEICEFEREANPLEYYIKSEWTDRLIDYLKEGK